MRAFSPASSLFSFLLPLTTTQTSDTEIVSEEKEAGGEKKAHQGRLEGLPPSSTLIQRLFAELFVGVHEAIHVAWDML